MAECYSIEQASIALSAGAAKTVLLATAASAGPFRVPCLTVSCDATATGLLKLEWCLGTITGGTTGTAPTIARMNGESYMVAPSTVATYYTAEPTYTKHASNGALVIKTLMIPTPFTPFAFEWPLGREWYCPASNALGLRFTSTTVAPNVWVNLEVEE